MCNTSSGSTSTNLFPEQGQLLKEQSSFIGNTALPGLSSAYSGLTNLYNQNAPGVTNAAQNLAGTANQAQQVLGAGGQSAYNTGITGLESLFSPQYEQNQINAALGPAQLQYQQNLANQGAQFGGSGELGSARQALAGQQLAGTNQINQAALTAGIQNNIAQQRAGVGQNLASLGQQGLTGAMGAANTQLSASQIPTSFFNSQYLGQLNQIPSYATPNWPAAGTSNNSSSFNLSNVMKSLGL
jgi:hypothetical protein